MYSSAVTIGSRQWQVSVATTVEELRQGLTALPSVEWILPTGASSSDPSWYDLVCAHDGDLGR